MYPFPRAETKCLRPFFDFQSQRVIWVLAIMLLLLLAGRELFGAKGNGYPSPLVSGKHPTSP